MIDSNRTNNPAPQTLRNRANDSTIQTQRNRELLFAGKSTNTINRIRANDSTTQTHRNRELLFAGNCTNTINCNRANDSTTQTHRNRELLFGGNCANIINRIARMTQQLKPNAIANQKMDSAGVAPASSVCRTDVFLLDDKPELFRTGIGMVRIELTFSCTQDTRATGALHPEFDIDPRGLGTSPEVERTPTPDVASPASGFDGSVAERFSSATGVWFHA